ncbi:DUF423 domain-containing protein [Rummeliibacillus suwonensis]|jgi:uncharacterized membrane protein YgdD (TMEM256/DUF423 family)|uniref:DUF423 domain-containing protein n=1 Tax=Rummeliibacillus suwonensis TaxID=1306154 RepID=UPI001AAE19B9|nr:DUF423 domain-containing protein [Rummeliibacillus suwonensis]MBO2535558.1 DUF423 domain-containing protein [Rummeliibacillus suwonensis]
MKFNMIAGAVFALLSVAFGAFGAHALKDVLTEHYAAVWETAVQYQMFHAVGLIVIGILMSKSLLGPTPMLSRAGVLMFIGVILFSGSLYVLSITQIKILGAITPIGGVLFLVAWLMVILAASKL